MDADVIIFLIFAIVVLVCFTVFAALSYSGLFYEPIVSTGEPPWQKSALVAYKFLRGPYNGNHVGATFTEVTCIAPNAPPIGVFYDNPRHKRPERLRCIVGCVLKERLGQDDEITHATDKEVEMLKEKKFIVHTIPCIELAVLADFPYTSPLSIWLAPNRVYQRLSQYIEERGLCAYPTIEVYKGGRIFYAVALSKQEDFFVADCSIADEADAEQDAALLDDGVEAVSVSDDVAPSQREVAPVADDALPLQGANLTSMTSSRENVAAAAVMTSSPPTATVAVAPSSSSSSGDESGGKANGDGGDSSFEEISGVEDLIEKPSPPTSSPFDGESERKSPSAKKRD